MKFWDKVIENKTNEELFVVLFVLFNVIDAFNWEINLLYLNIPGP